MAVADFVLFDRNQDGRHHHFSVKSRESRPLILLRLERPVRLAPLLVEHIEKPVYYKRSSDYVESLQGVVDAVGPRSNATDWVGVLMWGDWTSRTSRDACNCRIAARRSRIHLRLRYDSGLKNVNMPVWLRRIGFVHYSVSDEK